MKKKLLVTDFFRPEPGGLESFYTGMARHWSDRSLEVLVTTGRSHYMVLPRERREFDLKESYSIVRLIPRKRRLLFWLQNSDLASYLHARLGSGKYEQVLIGNLSPGPVLAAKTAKKFGIPHSVFVTGNDYRNRLKVTDRTNRNLLRSASHLFAFSNHIAEGLLPLGVSRNKILPLTPALEPRWSGVETALPLGLAEKIKGKGTIVGLGPLVPRKGLDRAIRALTELPDLLDRLHLVIIGSGPEYLYLEELTRALGLRENVSFTGFIPDELIAGILQVAHLVVQPGQAREDDEEAMSISLMEAAWFGLPVVAGALGGMVDVVRDDITGRLIEPGNVSRTAEMIRYFFMNEKARARMGREGRSIARKDFRMDLAVAAIETRIRHS